MSADRTVDQEVRIQATPERVWEALSRAEELVRWFPLEARVEPGKGGSIWISWGENCSGDQRIELWEPGRRLRTVQEIPQEAPIETVRLVIDFHIDGRNRGETVLRLVQSGFGEGEDWDREYDGVTRGWGWFLLQLKHYLEHHAGVDRRALWLNTVSELEVRPAWERLMGPRGLLAAGTPLGELRAGARYDIETASGDALRGEVLCWAPPHHFGVTVENLGDSLLLAEIEPGKGSVMPSLLLSTYGLDDELVDGLEERLGALVRAVFPEGDGAGAGTRRADFFESFPGLQADGPSGRTSTAEERA